MDINAKKVEIIQHILIIQRPETIRKIDHFIRGLEEDEEDGFYEKKEIKSDKKGMSRANVIGSKIKGMLNMYDK